VAKVRSWDANLLAKWKDLPLSPSVAGLLGWTALGTGTGFFACGVCRWLLPDVGFQWSRWAAIGTAWGYGIGLVWIFSNWLY